MADSAFSAEVHQWRGITLGKTPIDEVIRILGKPAKRSQSALRPTLHDKVLTPERKKKLWTRLVYTNIEDMKKVELWADKAHRAVMIHLQLTKKIEASLLPEIYSSKIIPWFTGLEVGMYPKDFEEHEGNVYAKTYPSVYRLLSENDEAYLEAWVDNSGIGSALKQTTGVRDTRVGYHGKVSDIYLISKTLKSVPKILE